MVVRPRTEGLCAVGSPARIRTLSYWYQKPVCCQLHHGGWRLRLYLRRACAWATIPPHQPSMRRYKSALLATPMTRQPR